MAICGKCGDEYESGQKCKPCRNNRLQELRQNGKVCVECGCVFDRLKGGKATRCPDCYPIYRQSYNLVGSCKNRANAKGLDFDLTVEWVMSQLEAGCPVTGEAYVFGVGSDYSDRHPLTPSVDKINPTLGYTQDNCRVVSWFYNVAKQQWTDEEVIELCIKVAKAHS